MTDFAYARMIIRKMDGGDNWNDERPQITQISQRKKSATKRQKAQEQIGESPFCASCAFLWLTLVLCSYPR
jgi:hypothetical protein